MIGVSRGLSPERRSSLVPRLGQIGVEAELDRPLAIYVVRPRGGRHPEACLCNSAEHDPVRGRVRLPFALATLLLDQEADPAPLGATRLDANDGLLAVLEGGSRVGVSMRPFRIGQLALGGWIDLDGFGNGRRETGDRVEADLH